MKRAFTLFEIIAALTLATILTFVLTNTLLCNIKVWESTSSHITLHNNLQQTTSTIIKDLESIDITNNSTPFFSQDNLNTFFKTSSNKVLHYQLLPSHNNTTVLHRSVTPYIENLPLEAHFQTTSDGSLLSTLCKNITTFCINISPEKKIAKLSIALNNREPTTFQINFIQKNIN